MKVLNILTDGLCMDGISNSVMGYYRNIDKELIKMDFVSKFVIDSLSEEIESNSNKVYTLKDRKKRPLKYLKELSKIIRENQYDIVHAHGSSSILCLEMIAAKKAGCKVRIAHSRNTKADHKILDKLLRPIFYKTYTHGFACGEEAGKWLFGKRKFEIINNGKDIEKFKYNETVRNEFRKKYNLENKVVIGHIGNFNEQKNHEFLIKILSELLKNGNKEYYCILIGTGYLQEKIKQQVEDLEIKENVLFVGQTEEVEKWIQAMDIMVFPSKFEGFPNVLVEWQIAGLPSIISDKITNAVQLTDLVKFESIEKSPSDWVEKICNIEVNDRNKNQQEILEQIKEKGFDIKENAKKLEKIYQNLKEEVG